MKKSLLSLAILAISSVGAFAQGYYYFKEAGISAAETWLAPTTGATTIIAGSTTAQSNILSASQNLPFAWTFYGLNVSQFKVSTSGYLTFDVSQTTDNTTNVLLPSASAPKLAIFPFWDNTKLQIVNTNFPATVASWITGTAPNRKLRIQWSSILNNEVTGTNVAFYGINLLESGGFEIIQHFGLGTFTSTVGCQNEDGTVGTSIPGSPNMNYGGSTNSYNPSAAVLYTFLYGVQPAIDLNIDGEFTSDVAGAGSGGAQIKVTAVNFGSTDIISAKMSYSIDNGSPVTAAATISVPKNKGRGKVTHPTAYVPLVADANTTKKVRVWFTEINGGADMSDTITFDVFTNKGVSGTKRVLIEEGSGAWCGYCPDGHNTLKNIIAQNADKVVSVVHHNFDLMEFDASKTINTRFATGYPYGMVDRAKFDDQDEVGLSRDVWTAKVTEQLAKPTPVNVSIINKNFDWAAGKVTYTVKVDFVDFAKPGDIRISTFIKEDKVRGPNIEPDPNAGIKGWNQHNYYTFEAGYQAGGPSHPLFTEPFNIVGYWHNEVARAIPSGTWGTAAVITDPSEGKSYTYQYTHTMTKASAITYSNNTDDDTEYRSSKNGRGWNKFEDTKIIAFVNYYDAANPSNMIVLNATETNMINTGVNELAENTIGEVSVYPNPANGAASVAFTLAKGSNVKIEAVNVLGQKVADIATSNFVAGEHTVSFDAAKLTVGIYFINITSEDGNASYRFVVTK
jgi:hypothetical protein